MASYTVRNSQNFDKIFNSNLHIDDKKWLYGARQHFYISDANFGAWKTTFSRPLVERTPISSRHARNRNHRGLPTTLSESPSKSTATSIEIWISIPSKLGPDTTETRVLCEPAMGRIVGKYVVNDFRSLYAYSIHRFHYRFIEPSWSWESGAKTDI